MEKLGQEPAFPRQGVSGMSKRLYIATQLTAARISNAIEINNVELIVSNAYALANELLKQENE